MLLLTGCAGMTNYATDFFKEMQDTDRYENVREFAKGLCENDSYDFFVDRFGKDTVDKWMVDNCSPVTRKVNPGI